ncbi:MAG: hypothetical protein IKW86_08000 [Salinivirgaceae bacterium]|nr:hypothetical protein [Salinivirgaceae bacterium]
MKYRDIQRLWGAIVSFIKKYRAIILLLFLYVAFASFWEKCICETLVDNFFCHFKSNIVCDILFYTISLFLIANIPLAIDKGISQFKFVICLVSLSFWLYYRFISDKFEWVSLTTIDIVKYIDIVAVYIVCVFMRHIIQRNPKPFDYKDGFVIDTPIENENDAISNRPILAKAAIDKILDTNTEKESFSFGIVAPWGMGKSSFMNMMKSQIEQRHSDECIVIKFNPWLYSNDTNIVQLFFDELSKSLKLYDSTLAKDFIDYSKALSSIGTTETKIISTILGLIGNSSKLEDKFDVIKGAIKKIGRKIIVFVDDIDRLDSSEIIEMLKLIRNVSNFPHMYFIVAYDKEYLLECLKGKMPNKELEFSEKIFQVEFPLPRFTEKELVDYILKTISELVDEGERKDLLDVMNNKLGTSPFDSISTIRDVKRICNSFNTSYSKLKGEVNSRDLFLLEILKNKYPTVYSILDKERKFVLNGSELFCENSDKNREPDFFDLFDDIMHKYDLKKFIKENKDYLHIKEPDIKRIESILDTLFQNDAVTSKKRINNILYTDRYFQICLLESDVSDLEFDKIIQNKVEEIKPIFKEWVATKSVSLFAKLKGFKAKDKDEHKKHIRLLLYLISNSQAGPDFNEITYLINELGNYNENKKLLDEDTKFIISALCENGYNKGLGSYLSSIIFEGDIWDYPLSRNELNNIRHIIFEDCLKRYYGDFATIMQGFYDTDDSSYKNGNRIYSFIPANIELMKDYVTSHFLQFIKYTIYSNPILNPFNDNQYIVNKRPLYFWPSWDDYISFIKNIENPGPAIFEYLDFLGKCLRKNNEDDYISFTFKHLKLEESRP